MRSLRPSLVAVLLIACGPDRQEGAPAAPKAEAPTTTTAARHEGSGTVLDRQGVGPELCLGAVAQSLPPQCRGIPLVGWDWAKVAGEQTAGDTTWGEYRVVGTWDGQRLTPTEPPGPPQLANDELRIETPCPTPAGGWPRPDPAKTGHADLDRVNAAAQAMPGFAGLWIDDPSPRRGEAQDLAGVVLNVAFAGDVAGREPALRELWGGALCVVRHAHSASALAEIRAQAEARARELGLELLTSDTDVVRGTVRLTVTAATAEQLAAVATQFGATVAVSARLRPVGTRG